ncbi:helix-turn-helix domain-containing protein [Acetobacterium bakii]|uniref:DNA-binding protein n=1 Tax=Acetobacterium bakii TaxID=52689 RepID=A0A0L6TXR7_9FIRM|nr:XRE family transcriptional regulator [Acetobacterium bakii]KNZ41074.1 DNA-binding protein [Acetobacterium bakii]
MTTPIPSIGENLKKIRTSQNLTLDEVAKITTVSKPMLGQIERGQSYPTVNTLWKIATGLKVPLSSFLRNKQAEYAVATLQAKDVIVEDNGRMRAYSLFAYDPVRNVETFYIEFDPGCNHCSEKHLDGVEEYILVLKGKMELDLNGKTISVEEKQALRFSADTPHAYSNPFEEICTVYNMIFYPY